MASQTLIAGAGANDASIGVHSWTLPGRITADDGTRTNPGNVVAFEQSTNWLVSSSHGFTVPDSTIDGIEVEVEQGRLGTGTAGDGAVRIVKGGVISATDRSEVADWPTTDTIHTYGSPTDLWGESWTATDINAAGFGVAISAIGTHADNTAQPLVDFIRITVYYTEGGGGAEPIDVDLTPATETDEAVALSFVQPIVKTLTPALETDQAVDLSWSGGAAPAVGPQHYRMLRGFG